MSEKKRWEEIDRFETIDEDGDKNTVVCYQRVIETRKLDGSISAIRSRLKEYRTVSGAHVNALDSETFKIVETDQIVRKIT